jgi:hypothetical protein
MADLQEICLRLMHGSNAALHHLFSIPLKQDGSLSITHMKNHGIVVVGF